MLNRSVRKLLLLTLCLQNAAALSSFSLQAQGEQLPSTCATGYVIGHINGVFVSIDNAELNLIALEQTTSDLGGTGTTKNPITGIEQPLKYALFYNHSVGGPNLDDISELLVLKAREAKVTLSRFEAKQIILGVFTSANVDADLALLDLQMLTDFAAQIIAESSSRGSASVEHTLSDLGEQALSTLLQGRALLLVSHSQGNFYANELVSRLRAQGGFNPTQLNVAHFAVPTRTLVGTARTGTYFQHVTWVGDRVMKRVRNFDHQTLPANYDDGIDYLPLDSYKPRVIPLNLALFGGHSFSDIYFGQYGETEVPFETGTTPHAAGTLFPIAVVGRSLIADGLRQIKPSQATTGPITATLTWSAPSDIDLHTREPDGSNVYWFHKKGRVGYLDRDDLYGTGPEHYFTSCTAIEEGHYFFGVNYYNDGQNTGAKTAYLTVTVFGKSWPPQAVELPTERGQAGSQSPQEVADVTLEKLDHDRWAATVTFAK